ncbi:MAG: hypothetical protein ACREDT_06670 [Methylocella sp.]
MPMATAIPVAIRLITIIVAVAAFSKLPHYDRMTFGAIQVG